MRSARLLHRPKPLRLLPPLTAKARCSLEEASPHAEGKHLHDLALIENEINLRVSWDSAASQNFIKKYRIPINPPKRPRNPMVRDKAFESMETNSSIDLSGSCGVLEE
eukprot:TRINITY_DN9702_c0_g1_i23.p2 TRINITY_DN9702_c0_g1~~TRINITY_DN9702_c0_g1_i23.p2  ORF type:complete len:108 (+),score=9.16 TRINITY_DN9702_c0_g1_i23:189-512(+)